MSRGINKFIGIGTVGKDPESKFMPNGNAVTNISIAVNENWKDKDGQKQERTEWIRIVFFNRLAEIVNEYVRKGSKLYVEGSLRTRSWEQDGVTKYATEIVASEMQMLDSRNGGPAEAQTDQSAQQSNARQPANKPAAKAAPGFDTFDDDIPF
jgi:single-strand DNA-binding protein